MAPDRYNETNTTSALIPVPPAEEAPPVHPPTPVEKKEETNNKPTIPPGIIPTDTERVLVVGKFVVMTADVENCDKVIVQGNLDGTIRSKYIVIMKGEGPERIECIHGGLLTPVYIHPTNRGTDLLYKQHCSMYKTNHNFGT